jgi:hypothetical protein
VFLIVDPPRTFGIRSGGPKQSPTIRSVWIVGVFHPELATIDGSQAQYGSGIALKRELRAWSRACDDSLHPHGVLGDHEIISAIEETKFE